jgi:hypothetical protein
MNPLGTGLIGRLTVDPALSERQVLRRYLDMSRYLSFLQSKSLYLARADRFDDKFEGSFTPSVRAAIRKAYKDNRIDFTYENFKRELRGSVYVSCWTLGLDDNMALWAMYGKPENTIAITTTVGRMRAALQAWTYPSSTPASIVKVEYIKPWRDPKVRIVPYSNIFRYKVTAYSFEQEVRIILDRHSVNFGTNYKEEGVLLPVAPAKFIRSVVVSPLAGRSFRDMVADVTNRYGVDARVRQSKLAMAPI